MSRLHKVISIFAAMVFLLTFFSTQQAQAQEATWKTAYIKRGMCGAFQDGWAKGPGSILRARTPLQFDGTRVKIFAMGCHQTDVRLEHLFLVRGADDLGKVIGPHFPILFAGQPTLSFTTGTQACSDEAPIPITAGTWYVQDSYLSSKMPYAYDVDSGTCEPKGGDEKELFSGTIKGNRVGIVTRIDVLTTDSRMSIVCYGDSITHGYNSTPNAGKRYPDQLAKLLQRPVLNMGVNGDMIQWAGGVPGSIHALQGVDTVIFLMGINDLINGSIKQLPDYTAKATQVISGLKNQKIKIYVGTILPAAGYAAFDKKLPEIETLRQEINTWLRTSSGADGVIDFDKAVADPQHPEKMRIELQSDFLHPSDAGYLKMSEAAAAVIKG